jgi:hypothetical protein
LIIIRNTLLISQLTKWWRHVELIKGHILRLLV